MAHLPPGVTPNLLSNFNPDVLEAWMDGGDIPLHGPHTAPQRALAALSTKTSMCYPLSLQEGHAGVLGRTVAKLIDAFQASPSPFMGTKIQDLIDRRKSGIKFISQAIIRGMKDANVYRTLNKPNFRVANLIASASHTIDEDYSEDTGGGVLAPPCFCLEANYWKPNAPYFYIGKTVNFRGRFFGHPNSTSKYGDLTRGSQKLAMSAICILNDQDILDFSFLAEQIFVCLFESYRSDLLVDISTHVQSGLHIEHIEAIEAALYFRNISQQLSKTLATQVPSADQDSELGLEQTTACLLWNGFNSASKYSSFVTIPMSKTRTLGSPCLWLCSKQHNLSRHTTIGLEWHEAVGDGSTAPLQNAPYYVVFEVRIQPHPQAWSRIPSIGSYLNWNQGRSLAIRIEWEYPPNSGSGEPGSHDNFAKTISMIQWLFGAKPNHSHAWITRASGRVHVLRAFYEYHTQNLEIKNQMPIAMNEGARITKADVIAAMRAPELGLLNVNGPFGDFTEHPMPPLQRDQQIATHVLSWDHEIVKRYVCNALRLRISRGAVKFVSSMDVLAAAGQHKEPPSGSTRKNMKASLNKDIVGLAKFEDVDDVEDEDEVIGDDEEVDSEYF
ncbi:hypothetical protein K505DRAFT_361718 [Melanomma pulvis-pyrius CBS 109.77]|uniref:GIY-YIG domain-containing protein n=1 Tax=Melanomma pulvis-pyrius CBS 109.77 TaxID=1314802 RepID=A0A6A6XBH1_9PLEO|nr:hypothetical protein K505DRAFT_361718 [Melanomma pulvis-pyrius CBS 109.77]